LEEGKPCKKGKFLERERVGPKGGKERYTKASDVSEKRGSRKGNQNETRPHDQSWELGHIRSRVQVSHSSNVQRGKKGGRKPERRKKKNLQRGKSKSW